MDLSIAPALLFTPGNKPERFAKAQTSGASGLILELEDGVPSGEKNLARDNVIQFLAKKSHLNMLTIVRINHITADAGIPDLLALKQADVHFDAILYPKTESAEELKIIYEVLHLEARKMKLLALIETVKGLCQLNSLVTNTPFLSGLVFGAADFAAEIGCELNWDALLFARYQIVQAAALAQMPAVDSPFFDFADDEKLINETLKAKELGFKGKLAIHPKQISAIKQSFMPTEEQIERAKIIINLYQQSGGKACQYKGQMIDVPVYKHAQQLLKLSQNIKGEGNV